MQKKILVLCTGNSCRSQMAEGYLRAMAGGKAEIFSAGVEAHGVNTMAVKVMMEDGVDISAQTSKTMDEYLSASFDFVITVCDNAKERCPVFPGRALKLHHDFPDPSRKRGHPLEIEKEFVRVRDQIKIFVRAFVTDNID